MVVLSTTIYLVAIIPGQSYVNSVYQLLLMKPCDALHHSKCAANKGGRSV